MIGVINLFTITILIVVLLAKCVVEQELQVLGRLPTKNS